MALEPANPEPHLNRGIAEEALQRWGAAETDYRWILEPPATPAAPAAPVTKNAPAAPAAGYDPEVKAAALYNLGNVQGSQGNWEAARQSFLAAADSRPGFAMARSSAALAAFQLGELQQAEREFRSLIRRQPLFADARAGLTALLWRLGANGEAESNWASASGLDPRYRQPEWLQSIRRWPPEAVLALEQFLTLASA
jgi:tetratricopeptide (TPR) repeat protein